MESYRGAALIQQAGHDVFVRCSFDVQADGGLKEWSGSFGTVTPTSPLKAGEATLRLPSATSGSIIIDLVDLASGDGTFVGSGPPPELTDNDT